MLIFFTFFLYSKTKEKIYLYYVGYSFFMWLYFIKITGLLQENGIRFPEGMALDEDFAFVCDVFAAASSAQGDSVEARSGAESVDELQPAVLLRRAEEGVHAELRVITGGSPLGSDHSPMRIPTVPAGRVTVAA